MISLQDPVAMPSPCLTTGGSLGSRGLDRANIVSPHRVVGHISTRGWPVLARVVLQRDGGSGSTALTARRAPGVERHERPRPVGEMTVGLMLTSADCRPTGTMIIG